MEYTNKIQVNNEQEEIGKIGRPTVITGEVVKKLENAFKMGASVTEVCSYAEISRQVFYNNLDSSSEFFDKMQNAVYSPKLKALKVVMSAVDKGDIKVAMWLLEKRYGFAQNSFNIELELPDKKNDTVELLREAIRVAKEMHDNRKNEENQ